VPDPWSRRDEWYGFQTNPRAAVEVLLRVDESSFTPGPGMMGDDHPIAWCHEFDGGRSFYTALGHTADSYEEPAFLEHLAWGIEWAAGRREKFAGLPVSLRAPAVGRRSAGSAWRSRRAPRASARWEGRRCAPCRRARSRGRRRRRCESA